MSLTFYFSYECDCDETIYVGPNLVLLDEHRGLPVVPIDMVEHTRIDCSACGRVHYVAELDVYTEENDVITAGGGDDEGDDSDDEDDEDDAPGLAEVFERPRRFTRDDEPATSADDAAST